jgi:hypothetical protein
MPRRRIGVVGVDSGQLMITDPCYIDSEWGKGGMNYEGAMAANGGRYGAGQMINQHGVPLAVSITHFGGDGVFPVYIEQNEQRRTTRIVVDLDGSYADERQ